jgi:hypothetical protein
MPHWIIQPWQRNLSKSASGKPGAVHRPAIKPIITGAVSLSSAGTKQLASRSATGAIRRKSVGARWLGMKKESVGRMVLSPVIRQPDESREMR